MSLNITHYARENQSLPPAQNRVSFFFTAPPKVGTGLPHLLRGRKQGESRCCRRPTGLLRMRDAKRQNRTSSSQPPLRSTQRTPEGLWNFLLSPLLYRFCNNHRRTNPGTIPEHFHSYHTGRSRWGLSGRQVSFLRGCFHYTNPCLSVYRCRQTAGGCAAGHSWPRIPIRLQPAA